MNEVLRKERKYLINLEQMYRDTQVLRRSSMRISTTAAAGI